MRLIFFNEIRCHLPHGEEVWFGYEMLWNCTSIGANFIVCQRQHEKVAFNSIKTMKDVVATHHILSTMQIFHLLLHDYLTAAELWIRTNIMSCLECWLQILLPTALVEITTSQNNFSASKSLKHILWVYKKPFNLCSLNDSVTH